LHVLSMPPAFTLSQDQTLRFISESPCPTTQMSENTRCPKTRGPKTNRPELVVCPDHHDERHHE
jgi:hypothetical protein